MLKLVLKLNFLIFLGVLVAGGRSFAATPHKSQKALFSMLGINDGSKTAFGYSYGICVQVGANQFVEVMAQAEFTNPYSANVGLGWNIVRKKGNSGDVNVTPAVMQNITPNVHHMVINPRGIDTSMSPGLNCYYLRNWAASDHPSVIGGNLIHEKTYGEIIVIVHDYSPKK